jgi:hypothetical protein
MTGLQSLPQIITAVGGIGTAAFGLVDATKVFWGGVNRIGFKGIRTAVMSVVPPNQPGQLANALPPDKILATLKANWYNGNDLGSQKAIAKSLIKLYLNPSNSHQMGTKTSVDPEALTAVAASIAAGTPLTSAQSDVYARFDLILTALLDGAYQHSDQTYRNGTRAWAVVASLLLAFIGGSMLHTAGTPFNVRPDVLEPLIVGLLATPLAPIAKDLSSALAATVNTLQLVKK